MPSAEISISSLPPDTPYAFERGSTRIVLVRTAEDIHAFEDVCPHAFWPLSAGNYHDGLLECPGHAWEFQVETGKCPESPGYCLTRFKTTILGDVVRVEWNERSAPSTGRRCMATSENL